MDVAIETARLVLRPLTLDDADALSLVLGDAETMRWYPAPFDRDGVVRWIEKNLERYEVDGFGLLAVEERATGELLGDCGPTIQHVDGDRTSSSAGTCAAIGGARGSPRKAVPRVASGAGRTSTSTT